jgi:hypothetical protein
LDIEKLIDKLTEKKARISKFKVWSIVLDPILQFRFSRQFIFVDFSELLGY